MLAGVGVGRVGALFAVVAVGEEATLDGDDAGMLESSREAAFEGPASHSSVRELGVSVVGLEGVGVTLFSTAPTDRATSEDSVSVDGAWTLTEGVFSSSTGSTVGLSVSDSGSGMSASGTVDGISGTGDSSYRLTSSGSIRLGLQWH